MAVADAVARTRLVPLVAAALAAGAVAWFAAGLVVQRSQAALLPARPDVSALPAPLREAIDGADAQARATPNAETIGALARVYHGSLRPADALPLYELAARLQPANWQWPYLRAVLLEERGDQDAARAALDTVTVQAPQAGLAWYRLGEIAFKQGRLDDARRAYERALTAPGAAPFTPAGVASRKVTPLAAYASAGLARVARDRGERGDAAGAPSWPPADPLVDAVVAESRHSDLLLKHAGLATRAGDSAWREYLVRRALAFNPQDLNVLMEVAALLQATGRANEALTYLRQHETLAPGDHHGLVEQGRALIDLNRLDEAEAVLRRAAAVRDAAAEYNLGLALDRQGRWDEARQHYEQALAIDRFHARAMNNVAVGLDQRGQSGAAMPLFERAIQVSPEAAEFHLNYGTALLQQQRLDDAERAIRAGLALDPRSANGHSNLGIVLANRGQLAPALDEFRQALALDPRHDNARRNAAVVAARLGEPPPR